MRGGIASNKPDGPSFRYQGSIDIECWHDPVYSDELEMTGQVRALNYPKECRGGAFVANP
jgi:hypothetical protein